MGRATSHSPQRQDVEDAGSAIEIAARIVGCVDDIAMTKDHRCEKIGHVADCRNPRAMYWLFVET
ncbi:MAG: hypothetical protein BGP19_01300 [Thiobacillus sp. 0-1251]|nr:MAG: hypothetical protein ABT23_00995 [Thiobacillus sp. SCN 63-57]OJY57677.1 MAG: hypothetical protein BGP19_01300 [Thiobacillus sp. 0-1251]